MGKQDLVFAPGLKSQGDVTNPIGLSSLAPPLRRIAWGRDMDYVPLDFLDPGSNGLCGMKQQVQAALSEEGEHTLFASSMGAWATLLALPNMKRGLWPRRVVLLNPVFTVEHIRRRYPNWVAGMAMRTGFPRWGSGTVRSFWVEPSMVEWMLSPNSRVLTHGNLGRLQGLDMRIVVTEESMYLDPDAIAILTQELRLPPENVMRYDGPLDEPRLEYLMFD